MLRCSCLAYTQLVVHWNDMSILNYLYFNMDITQLIA